MTGHLIHIGFPKTGSNFLRRWFAEHPQLKFEPGGIAGYRDVYDIARQSAAPEARAAYRVTSYEGITTPNRSAGLRQTEPNDTTPTAETLEWGCSALASVFPNAHILVVTRGFRSMLMSAYSQYVRSGGADDLEAMARPDHESENEALWHYDLIIGLYRKAFAGRVIALPYELLRDDPPSFTKAIEDQLGLEHHPPPVNVMNASLSPFELRWYPRLTRLVRSLPIGGRTRQVLLRAYLPLIGGRGLAGIVALLQRLKPLAPVGADKIPTEVLQMFPGRAETLRSLPLYAPYAEDYHF